MHSKTLLASLIAPAAVSAVLNDLAVRAGLKYFGAALGEGPFQSDSTYASILGDTSEFGQVVPENGMKWESTERTEGVFTYGSGDVSANQAKKSGQVLRCHALVWHSQLPSWVSGGTWTVETLTAVMESHISNVVGHYKGQCYAWDVLNEAIGDDGNWRSTVFLDTFNGTDYIPVAFNLARAADPDTKLYYNDYNLEYNGAKTDRAVELVQLVQAAGAPIDGVGFQGHLIVASTPSRSSLAATLQRFTALGVEVAYTEVDIRHSSLPAPDSAYATQGNDYASVVGSCVDTPNCVGVTVWGVTDKYSWIPGVFDGEGDALLYDANFTRKAAWTSVSSVLAAKATLPPASSTAACGPTGTVTVTATATAEPVTVTVTSIVTLSSTASAAGPTQTLYGQCGGHGYTGPTRCGPYLGTCKVQNDWYHQCV